jgi:hypothetical protein
MTSHRRHIDFMNNERYRLDAIPNHSSCCASWLRGRSLRRLDLEAASPWHAQQSMSPSAHSLLNGSCSRSTTFRCHSNHLVRHRPNASIWSRHVTAFSGRSTLCALIGVFTSPEKNVNEMLLIQGGANEGTLYRLPRYRLVPSSDDPAYF